MQKPEWTERLRITGTEQRSSDSVYPADQWQTSKGCEVKWLNVHTVDTLAVRGDEGRANLQKAPESWYKALSAGDVQMRKPGAIRSIIVRWIDSLTKQPGGTETSQYPEEKSTKISSVAASEREAAQNQHQLAYQESGLESPKMKGDSPVSEGTFVVRSMSRTGHVMSCLKMGGPSSKAKYFWLTDSEPAPWEKGERNPGKGSETEPETMYVQAVGVPLVCDCVPFV